MNPSYIKKPTDKDAVRRQYLNNLKVDTANMTRNFNANVIFKETGQTRPNALPDTRTTTDKRADLERLKLELQADLGTITDKMSANKISQTLSPDLLVFATDQIQIIMRELKLQYANGFPANIGVAFITKLKRKYAITEGVDFGVQQFVGTSGLVTDPGTIAEMSSREDLEEAIHSLSGVSPELQREVKRLQKALLAQAKNTLTKADMDLIEALNPDAQVSMNERVSGLMGDRMSNHELNERIETVFRFANIDNYLAEKEIEELRKIIVSGTALGGGDYSASSISSDLHSMSELEDPNWADTEEDIDSMNPEHRQQWKEAVEANDDYLLEGEREGIEEPDEDTRLEPRSRSAVEAEPVEEEGKMDIFAQKHPQVAQAVAEEKEEPTAVSSWEDFIAIPSMKKKKDWLELKGFKDQIRTRDGNPVKLNNVVITSRGGKSSVEWTNTNIETIVKGYFASGGKGLGRRRKIHGQGLLPTNSVQLSVKPVRSRADRLAHLIDTPMEKPKPYTPFGKYVIHKHKLQDGILQVKTAKGGPVAHIPTEYISSELTKVLRKIVGGTMVEYDELSDLHDDDKGYLNRIVKTAHLSDRISVPKPSGSKEKEDLKRFQILKGEIGAGNDNKDLVKEFKVMLMRFVNQGRVPRRQAHEILTDLASQGL